MKGLSFGKALFSEDMCFYTRNGRRSAVDLELLRIDGGKRK